jgi:diguanylate cyclase (GGDEF)-like protein
MKGAIVLSEEIVNGLLRAVVGNARGGKISQIAARVTDILKNYLKCDKVIFLKNSNGRFELYHYAGLKKADAARLEIEIPPEFTEALKDIDRVAPITRIRDYFDAENFDFLNAEGFNYFFAVFLRGRLSGVYLIKSELPAGDPSLKLLTSALSFSLSAVDYIRKQDQKIRRYEDRLKGFSESGAFVQGNQDYSGREMVRLLKIKNSKRLVAELLKFLKKEYCLSNIAFSAGNIEGQSDADLDVNWQFKEDLQVILRERGMISEVYKDGAPVIRLSEIKGNDAEQDNTLERIRRANFEYVARIPWPKNRLAYLLWNVDTGGEDKGGLILDFWREVFPVIEHIESYKEARELSYTDGLTGMANFRYFQKRLHEEIRRAERYGRSLALLIFDVDELKIINDRFGHQVGDSLLKSFGKILVEAVRSVDVVCRYGGDEFCIIMPETGRNRTRLLMERIRKRISENPFSIDEKSGIQHYTVSIGGAVYPVDTDSAEGLVRAADLALLKAKKDGRNCCRIYEREFQENRAGLN